MSGRQTCDLRLLSLSQKDPLIPGSNKTHKEQIYGKYSPIDLFIMQIWRKERNRFCKSSSHIFSMWPPRPHTQTWLHSLFLPSLPRVSEMHLMIRKTHLKKKKMCLKLSTPHWDYLMSRDKDKGLYGCICTM